MVFVGRKYELEMLEELGKGEGVKTCLIYGKRRVGKSELINQFCKNKRSIDFEFTVGSTSSQLQYMTDVMTEATGKHHDTYDTMYRCLKDLASYCKESETIVVFDEFQYLVIDDDDGAIASEFQRFVDTLLKNTETMVILCGSYSSMMIELTSDPHRPLYGRFPNSIKLEPLSLKECSEMHPTLSDLDALKLYLTIGGIPGFHTLTKGDTYEECIWNAFFRKQAPLEKEIQLLIGTGTSKIDMRRVIIRAISEGAVTNKDIADKTKIERVICGNQIHILMELDVLDTYHPMYGAPKRPRYFIKDNAIAFYYEVYEANRAKIVSDKSAETLGKLEHYISTFLGIRFELVCQDYVKRNYYCTEIGRWWGVSKGEGEREIVDIDVTAKVESKGYAVDLFGECKMRNRLTGFTELNELVRRVELTKTDVRPRYILFSTSGFTDDLKDHADQRNDLVLVDLDMIMGRSAPEPL